MSDETQLRKLHRYLNELVEKGRYRSAVVFNTNGHGFHIRTAGKEFNVPGQAKAVPIMEWTISIATASPWETITAKRDTLQGAISELLRLMRANKCPEAEWFSEVERRE